MRDILGNHKQNFNEIRRLCLICHGLDLTTSSMSLSHSRLHISNDTEVILHNLVSSNMLNLAIALRINLYQSNINQPNLELPNCAWLYFDDELIDRPATLKQVCDKIIHADSVSKPIFPSELISKDSGIAVQFRGIEFRKKAWTLNIVMVRFVEDVLAMLDKIESKSPIRQITQTANTVEYLHKPKAKKNCASTPPVFAALYHS